jgi:RNA polymerase-interacting CarD/CdnL/TRCF family regulator
MAFAMNDQVVYPAFGVGRIVGLTAKTVGTAASQMYYEVSGDRTTAWVAVDEGAARGLRALTRKDELAHFRSVLRGQPSPMNGDFRKRQLALRDQLKAGTLQSVCEVVRDLNGRSWAKTLNDSDLHTLRRSSLSLHQEWAAADDITLAQATAEVNGLLKEGRETYAAPPAVPAGDKS